MLVSKACPAHVWAWCWPWCTPCLRTLTPSSRHSYAVAGRQPRRAPQCCRGHGRPRGRFRGRVYEREPLERAWLPQQGLHRPCGAAGRGARTLKSQGGSCIMPMLCTQNRMLTKTWPSKYETLRQYRESSLCFVCRQSLTV